MIDFFIENNVSICTSIDENEELQNKNRPYKYGNSYRKPCGRSGTGQQGR